MKARRSSVVLTLLLCSASPWLTAANVTETEIPAAPTSEASDVKSCKDDSECGDTDKVKCDTGRQICVCQQANYVLSAGKHCLEGKRPTEKCLIAEQCLVYDSNSTCSDNVCICAAGFQLTNLVDGITCQLAGQLLTTESSGGGEGGGQGGGGIKDKNVLIVLIVFGLMFVGICVALNMFSRARFRNNRSIFSNPHPRLMHIKLGKKKGHRRGSHASMQGGSRQPSVCSQLSPLPSRAGSRRASQQSVRSNPDKRTDHLGGGTVLSVDEIAKKLQDSPRRPSTSATHPVQNGPNSPTIIVTNAPGHRQVDDTKISSSPVNV